MKLSTHRVMDGVMQNTDIGSGGGTTAVSENKKEDSQSNVGHAPIALDGSKWANVAQNSRNAYTWPHIMTRNEYVVDMPADGSSRPGEHSVATLDRQQQQDTSNSISDSGFIHLSPTAKCPEALITTAEAPAPLTWYFQEDQDKSSAEEYIFKCTTESCPPVKATANNRFTRLTGNTRDCKEPNVKIFNVVLGLSLQNLKLEGIESISFSMGPGDSYTYGTLETIPKSELTKMARFVDTGVLRLALHRQCVESAEFLGKLAVDIEIRTCFPKPSDVGFIELHYMQFLTTKIRQHQQDVSLQVHRPFLWSIDVAHEGASPEDGAHARSAKIMHYAVSGDGSHVATTSVLEGYLQLDLWDLELDGSVVPLVVEAGVEVPQSKRYPQLCGRVRMKLDDKLYPGRTPFTVSVSWQASMVALISDSPRHIKKAVQIFNYGRASHTTSKKGPSSNAINPNNSLVPWKDDQLLSEIGKTCLAGKFHITTEKDPDVKDELFITCDRISINIFDVHQNWAHVRTIRLVGESFVESSMHRIDYMRLMDGMRGRYFSWTDVHYTTSICDIETGMLVSRIPKTLTVSFSSDGSMMAARHLHNVLSTLWTESGTCIASKDVCRTSPTFIKDGSQILVPMVTPDETYGRAQLGMIMGTTNLSDLHRVSLPISRSEQIRQRLTPDGQNAYLIHGSKLDLVRLDDTIIKPYPQPRDTCDQSCIKKLKPIYPIAVGTRKDISEVTMQSGLTFKVEFKALPSSDSWSVGTERWSVVILTTDGEGTSGDIFVIPAPEIGDNTAEWLEYQVTFDMERQEMIVYSSLFIMVWSLPKTIGEEFTLILTWWVQVWPFETNHCVDWNWAHLSQCPHQLYYITTTYLNERSEEVDFDIFQLHPEAPSGSSYSFHFLNGVLALAEIFCSGDDLFKNAVLQYIGRYLNDYPNPSNLEENIFGMICNTVTESNLESRALFLRALFDSPYGCWVPRPDFNKEMNPICILLRLTSKLPRTINLVQLFVNNCIQRAKEQKDLLFLSPLIEPLHDLIDQQHLYTELVYNTLCQLAFLPVKDRAYIIDHHSIVHPPEFRFQFWKRNARQLHDCKDPTLQLDRTLVSKEHNQQYDNFTRDIFVAPFGMLWHAPDAEDGVAERSHSWVQTILYAIWLNCQCRSPSFVERHAFSLESLDNPAIAALIEYKWNTIGFTYWLVRFSCQCLYYLLVLIAVFMQVYGNYQRMLGGVFIAIIVLSVIFLWLELSQFIHNWKRYLSSPYNYVDVAAFVLPLAGSISQLYILGKDVGDGNADMLSFSVLIVFVHMLFELRVSKTICHFITIIVRIMSEIRVFFLVFAAGILAFTIAILHLLRACPFGNCEHETSFPLHFYGAVSSTYFFMGGRYDPVNQEFDEDNWSFHTMMMIYFFFTAILLLNVLIALINVAFSVGDDTWRQVWLENKLEYIESAENMSYQIPGFRTKHNWFPKEIYYSATLQQVEEFLDKNTKRRKGENSHKLFGQISHTKSTGSAIIATERERTLNGLKEIKKQQEQQIVSLKQELKYSQTQLAAVQSQFIERQQALEDQIKELQAANNRAFRETRDLLSALVAGRS